MSKNLCFYPDFYDCSRVQKLGGKHMMQHCLNMALMNMHINVSDIVQM